MHTFTVQDFRNVDWNASVLVKISEDGLVKYKQRMKQCRNWYFDTITSSHCPTSAPKENVWEVLSAIKFLDGAIDAVDEELQNRYEADRESYYQKLEELGVYPDSEEPEIC